MFLGIKRGQDHHLQSPRQRHEEGDQQKEETYHRFRRCIHPLDQSTGGGLVQLDEGLPAAVRVKAGDRPDDGSDGLAALDDAGVQLESFSHPPAKPSAEPNVFTGARPGVALESHPACKILRLNIKQEETST